jgi:FixJ family two-component response regulator
MPGDPPLLAVVDDDADVRIALVRLVSSAGFAAESFATGRVPPFDRATRADYLILGCMPGMSSFDVQAALAQSARAHSGRGDHRCDSAESRSRARDLGARGYLPKPVEHEALLAAIGAMSGPAH